MKAIDMKEMETTEFKNNIYELAAEFTTNKMFGDSDLSPVILFCNKLKRNGFESISIDTVKNDDQNLTRTYFITVSKNYMEAYIHAIYSFRTMSHEKFDMNVVVANVVAL